MMMIIDRTVEQIDLVMLVDTVIHGKILLKNFRFKLFINLFSDTRDRNRPNGI